VNQRDPELDRLLCEEIERRLPALRGDATSVMDARAVLHALKGSAAMAGYSELALVIGQFGERVRESQVNARADAVDTLSAVLGRLRSGRSPFATSWPEPPPPLSPSRVDARFAVEYHAAMRDRLIEIDLLLADDEEPATLLEHAVRTIHTIKGAAAAVGDDVVAWYCHGLETRLSSGRESARAPREMLMELSRDRVLLALLIDDGTRGLETLRAVTGSDERKPRPGPPSRPPSVTPGSHRPPEEEPALRVGPSALDQLVDRLEGVDAIGDDLASASAIAARMSARLSGVRHSVLDALRRIGPARPWGPPTAALAELEAAGDALRRAAVRASIAAVTFRSGSNLVRTRTRDLRAGLAALGRTSIGGVFERVRRAVLRFADQQGKLVSVQISGAEVAVDRALAEQMMDAVLQLAKNAVTHGIQTPDRRELEGKAPTGTIWLRAEREGGFIRVQVEDDGSGANVERIREAAAARELASAELLSASAPSDLLGLLLLPGMTTERGADLLAGRGVGLEVVQAAARRFGGAVRLMNRENGGLVATLELPNDQRVVEVLWIEERGTTYAMPVSYAGRVLPASETNAPRLSVCLGARRNDQARLELELMLSDMPNIRIGIDRALSIELVALRALPPRIASSGPFAGAIHRHDGALLLALDGPSLAARAHWLRGSTRAAPRS
jgi:two-component system chemotaxis sensor kinase CheA